MSKELGQFFTINEGLQQYVFDHVEHKGAQLLEPSFGSGHLLKKFLESDADYPMECYEIDSSIEPCINFNDNQRIVYGDFMSHEFDKKFKTIIGNPPYVKQSKGNLYIQFIEKCYHLLDDDGETREDIKLPDYPEDYCRIIQKEFDDGKQLIVTVLKACGHEQIMAHKVDSS